MGKYMVKYQIIFKGSVPSSPSSTMVSASSIYEAKQVFKYNHVDTINKKYKIIAAVKVR